MTTLLALDTATEACSVALWHQHNVYCRYEVIPRLHAQKLLPMVQEVIAEAGISLSMLDAIAFGRGPGAFTGVRIVAGVVQGLAFGLDLPVIAVSDLAIIAQRAYRQYQAMQVAVAIDARMDEIYWGCYHLIGEEMCLLGEEMVAAPEQVLLPNTDNDVWFCAGTGWRYSARLPLQQQLMDSELLPDAQDLLTLAHTAWLRGKVLAVDQVEPVYLRDKVATPKK